MASNHDHKSKSKVEEEGQDGSDQEDNTKNLSDQGDNNKDVPDEGDNTKDASDQEDNNKNTPDHEDNNKDASDHEDNNKDAPDYGDKNKYAQDQDVSDQEDTKEPSDNEDMADDGSDKGRESPQADDKGSNHGDESDHQDYGQQKQLENPEDFDSKSFLSRVTELHDKLEADGLKHVDDDFPADDLEEMVNSVTSTMGYFKQYAMHTQNELEKVREQMKEIKERIHKRIQAKGYDIKSAHEKKGLEERELEAKVAQLNKEVAKAAEELARASQITVDTEAAAAEASLVAEQASAEAQRIQAEYEARKKAETESRKAEEARREEAQKRRDEEERKQEEIRREDEERKAKLRKPEEQKAPEWESWPHFTYNVQGEEFTQGIGCIIRGESSNFRENMVKIEVVDAFHKKNILEDHEELISCVISMKPTQEDDKLQSSIFVSIPHCISRTSAISREPVIKAEVEEGKWVELKGQEVTFENTKDVKFVQAEVKAFSDICVVTRFKRDYLHLSKKGGKVSSNVDARVTFTAEKGTFQKVENFVLQLQPIDSATIIRVKEKSMDASKFLTCSSLVHMEWGSQTFGKPINMTLPCPPNPVKAKKAAAARAAKEAKMKNPQLPAMAAEVEVKRVQRKKTKTVGRKQNLDDDDDEYDRKPAPPPTKWYMGQYGNNEEDENDILYFLKKMPNNKWAVQEHMTILQIKLDLLQLRFTEPINRFMVMRTRTNTAARDAQVLAEAIESCLKERVVGVVLRQKSDNLCDVALTVVHNSRLDKVIAQLDEEGYEPSSGFNQKDVTKYILNEGDKMEVSFTGNVKCQNTNTELQFVFHSQMSSQLKFSIIEVDRYLQKGYSEFKGFAQVDKKWQVVHMPTKKEESEGETEPRVEIKSERVSKHLVRIPKEDEASPRPMTKTQPKFINLDSSLDEETLRYVAQSLGEEWTRVANYLNVKKQRIQAILRNNVQGEEEDVKYDMLLTWVKKVPRSTNKTAILIEAVDYAKRPDLASYLKKQENYHQEGKKGVVNGTHSDQEEHEERADSPYNEGDGDNAE